MSQHGAGPSLPFFDQQRGLRYAYDARSDSIRFENGDYMPRPPRISPAALGGVAAQSYASHAGPARIPSRADATGRSGSSGEHGLHNVVQSLSHINVTTPRASYSSSNAHSTRDRRQVVATTQPGLAGLSSGGSAQVRTHRETRKHVPSDDDDSSLEEESSDDSHKASQSRPARTSPTRIETTRDQAARVRRERVATTHKTRAYVSNLIEQGNTENQAIALAVRKVVSANQSYTLERARAYVLARLQIQPEESGHDAHSTLGEELAISDDDDEGEHAGDEKEETGGEDGHGESDTEDININANSSYPSNRVAQDMESQPVIAGASGVREDVPDRSRSYCGPGQGNLFVAEQSSVVGDLATCTMEAAPADYSSDDRQTDSDFDDDDETNTTTVDKLRKCYALLPRSGDTPKLSAVDVIAVARRLSESFKSQTLSATSPAISLTPLHDRMQFSLGHVTSFDQSAELVKGIAESCWLSDILPTSLLTFTENGIIIPIQQLFDQRLFANGYLLRRPSWLKDGPGYPVRLDELNTVDEIYLGTAGLLSALELLVSNGYGNGDLRVIVESQTRDNVAEVVRLKVSELNRKSIGTLLHTFGLRLEHWSSRDEIARTRAAIRLRALAAVSYAGSHCRDFRQAVWTQFEQEAADKQTQYFVYEHRRLACLEEDIGGPVWMVACATGGFQVPQAISLTLLDYADLWGPLSVARSSDDTEALTAIHSKRGEDPFATAPFELPCHWTRTWIQCRTDVPVGQGHAKDLSVSCDEQIPMVPLTFRITSRLLIGNPTAGVETMQASNVQVPGLLGHVSLLGLQHARLGCRPGYTWKHSPGFISHAKCGLTKDTLRGSKCLRLARIDTSKAKFVPESYTFGFNGGFHVNVTGTKTFKYTPAKTLKSCLIDDLKGDRIILPAALELLELRIGLAVSPCTWNSRRVNLWTALKLAFWKPARIPVGSARMQKCPVDKMRAQVESCKHKTGDPTCILECWGVHIAEAVRTRWTDRLSRDNAAEAVWAECLQDVLPELIPRLKDTGVDRDGNLRVWWPFGGEAQYARLPKSTASWLDVIKDSEGSATFAVFDQECWGYRSKKRHRRDPSVTSKCQSSAWEGSGVAWSGPERPVLKTTMVVSTPVLMTGGCRLYCLHKILGVVRGNRLSLPGGDELVFCNEDVEGQLAIHETSGRRAMHVRDHVGKMFGYLEHQPAAKELLDEQADPGYRIPVNII
ncbi:hypothetical protein LTR56_011204 [Elasticomyces elasticus]|nr:hypothetical protein LTR56_011204 [Elasticomyces elasticus]KAK3650431.1 hypothetical protein LTR22_012522 [Elasticomyces elasticus]KAK4921836.1 hypothetical protein LTR49_010774 [Elasticomyces elasticus]KAK5753444.1 hypothetical protein LTS12_016495 [Elasticomyces elasticus]